MKKFFAGLLVLVFCLGLMGNQAQAGHWYYLYLDDDVKELMDGDVSVDDVTALVSIATLSSAPGANDILNSGNNSGTSIPKLTPPGGTHGTISGDTSVPAKSLTPGQTLEVTPTVLPLSSICINETKVIGIITLKNNEKKPVYWSTKVTGDTTVSGDKTVKWLTLSEYEGNSAIAPGTSKDITVSADASNILTPVYLEGCIDFYSGYSNPKYKFTGSCYVPFTVDMTLLQQVIANHPKAALALILAWLYHNYPGTIRDEIKSVVAQKKLQLEFSQFDKQLTNKAAVINVKRVLGQVGPIPEGDPVIGLMQKIKAAGPVKIELSPSQVEFNKLLKAANKRIKA